MILHLARDDKFVDDGFKQFETASPNNNELVIITESEKLVYIKTDRAIKVTTKELLSPKFINRLKEYEFVSNAMSALGVDGWIQEYDTRDDLAGVHF